MPPPSLGLPPRDNRAGFPGDAAALRSSRLRTAARALEAAIHEDPTLRERHSDLVLRNLLADLEAMTDQEREQYVRQRLRDLKVKT